MRLLVCGGRLYSNAEHAESVLEFLHSAAPFSLVMGELKFGAMRLAAAWAKRTGVPTGPFSWAPDVVLAFMTSPKATAAAHDFARAGYRVLDAKTGQEVRA